MFGAKGSTLATMDVAEGALKTEGTMNVASRIMFLENLRGGACQEAIAVGRRQSR
jgi:hypothetical protein